MFVCNYIILNNSFAQPKNLKSSEELTLDFDVSNVDLKSATFSWSYPEDMKFSMGDYINLIVIDEDVGDNGQVPIFSVAHNMDNINLKSITKFETKSLAASTNYKAKIELVKSNGDVYLGEYSFSTVEFTISDMAFQGVVDNKANKKNIRITWNVSHKNFELDDGDKIQIFMKKFSDNDFFKTPIYETKDKLTRADIEVPNFEEDYEFKIVYVMGEKKVESEIFGLNVSADGIDFKVKDITSSSAKLDWYFQNAEVLNATSQIEIFAKESSTAEYVNKPILSLKGREDLIDGGEYFLDDLKPNTKYNVKVKYIVEYINQFDKNFPVTKEDEYEFTTGKFAVKDLKITPSSNNRCVLSWDYDGDAVTFSEDDNAKIFIKESSVGSFSQETLTISESLLQTKKADLVFPKFNTKYDVKIVFNVGEKYIDNYISYVVEVPEIDFKIKEIKNNSLKIIATVNEKTIFEDGDKIQIFAKKQSETNFQFNPIKEIVKNPNEQLPIGSNREIEINIPDVQANLREEPQDKKYDFKINVIKNQNIFQEKIYSVEFKNDSLQIVNVSFIKKNEKEIDAIVEYAPSDYEFNNKVTSLSLFKSKYVEENNSTSSPNNTKKENSPKADQEIKSDFKTNNKFTIKFEDFSKYKLKFTYTLKKQSGSSSGADTSDGGTSSEHSDAQQQAHQNQNGPSSDSTDIGAQGQAGNIEGSTNVNTQPQTGSNGDDRNQTNDHQQSNEPNEQLSQQDGQNNHETNDREESLEPVTKSQILKKRETTSSSSSPSESSSTPTPNETEKVEREVIYDNKFDIFSFGLVDVVMNEIKLSFDFKNYYTFKNRDKIEIFVKKVGEEEFKDLLVTFEHNGSSVNLGDIENFDLVGLDPGNSYVFKAKLSLASNKDAIIEKEVEVSTVPITLDDVTVEHISDLTGVVRWRLGNNFKFGPDDVLNIFYKKENESSYPSEPNEIIEEINLTDSVFIYMDNIDKKYDVKLVFKSGEKTLEKELKFNTSVDNLDAMINDIYQTSAYLKWNYPKDYMLTDGESISVFVKESSQSSYGEEPDYFMEQNEEESEILDNFKSAKLFDLLPNTNYDVKVFLDLGDIGTKELEISFKTEDILISDLQLTEFKPYEFNVFWELNSDTIDFNEEYDSLDIYMKIPEETWNEDNLIYSFSKNLNNFNKVRFVVDDVTIVYDVKIEYNLVNKKISKTFSTGLFYIDYNEQEYGTVDVIVKYPSAINFKDGDELIVYVAKPKQSNYEQKFLSKQSSSNDLKSLRGIILKDLKQTSSIAASLKSKSVKIFPSEIIYDTRAENSSTLEIVSELKGGSIDIDLPVDYELDLKAEIRNSIGGRSYYEKLDDGTYVIVIDNIVPKKVYKETKLIAQDVDGKEVELFIDEFTLEPENLLEDFLYNSYYFAFDRSPDEGGYTYWKGKLEENGDITGRYFLVNLMFAEKEFADRNLEDDALVKVLYQIVVNRTYDSKGLSYWVAIYKQYLNKFNGDRYEAKKTIVMRMVNEPEFQRLCKKMKIKW